MSLYDVIISKLKKIQGETEEPVTNIAASSTLAAEITLLSSLLVAVVMLRFLNTTLMIVAVLILIGAAFFAMPLMPKLKSEQNDSINSMIFYVILALGIIVTIFYWGKLNV